jgi:hypothetical protein
MVDIINNYRYFRGILEVKLITGCGFFDFGFWIWDLGFRIAKNGWAKFGLLVTGARCGLQTVGYLDLPWPL